METVQNEEKGDNRPDHGACVCAPIPVDRFVVAADDFDALG